MADNIIQRIAKKIRPGSGGPAQAISIIDGATGRAPSIRPFQHTDIDDDGDFDDTRSGMPMALSSHYGVASDVLPQPTGTLPGVDEQGNIPSYAPDDVAVLNRMFGLRLPND
jgi:hypothetical protein